MTDQQRGGLHRSVEAPTTCLEHLLEQVRYDLATAGLYVAPPAPLDDEDQGGVAVYIDERDQVLVDWLPHARLNRAALAMVDADRLKAEPVMRYEVIRSTMDTALASILAGFGYATSRPQSGRGHIIGRAPVAPGSKE